MARAAVPSYLGTDFSQASPALRFGLFFRAWDNNWALAKDSRDGKEGKMAALKHATALPEHSKKLSEHLRARQHHAAQSMDDPSRLLIQALAIAPFATGLGNEHPTENGFAFLNPYGIPYLPGSGVKGALRQAARELASSDWDETAGWNEAAITALFGLESKDSDTVHQRGALSFWDVIPKLANDKLLVEIMTPHQTHYYQGKESPHDSGQPNPIGFLTVPPKSVFMFHVRCDVAFLRVNAPALAQEDAWKRLMGAAFEHAFAWLGFGAKTAVGYGAMKRNIGFDEPKPDPDPTPLPPNLRRIEEFKSAFEARAQQLRGGFDQPNTKFHDLARALAKAALEESGWSVEEKRAAADAISDWLPKVVRGIDNDALRKLRLAALRGLA